MSLHIRLFLTWLRACYMAPIKMGDTIELKLRVWPQDLDINGHMNNGRYMTITDLALIEYLTRTGFIKVALRNGWRPMLGGSIISYRRGLKPFAEYTLRFSIICWDERWNYMTFEFLQNGTTMALGHSKGAVVGSAGIVSSADAREVMGLDSASPQFPVSVCAWIETERLMAV